MLYEAQCNHDGLFAGQLYELTAEDEAHHAASIEAGFLTRVAGPDHWAGWQEGDNPASTTVEPAATAPDQAPEPTE